MERREHHPPVEEEEADLVRILITELIPRRISTSNKKIKREAPPTLCSGSMSTTILC
jgi:hypothetical protein